MTTTETRAAPKQQPRRGARRHPEDEWWDTVKKKPVWLTLRGTDRTEISGILEWVSTYAIGFRTTAGICGHPADVVELVNKGAIVRIRPHLPEVPNGSGNQ